GMGRVKEAQGKLPEAASYFEKAIAIVPMPDFVASLGDVYTLMNRPDEAKKQYALVEYIGLISQINKEIYNRQLALFYADHDRSLPQALALATAEIDFRTDVYGYDALAWCLYKNGKIQEAQAATEKALVMKTQDPLLFYHAGMIYAAAGNLGESRKWLEAALLLNPDFHPVFAPSARATLSSSQLAKKD